MRKATGGCKSNRLLLVGINIIFILVVVVINFVVFIGGGCLLVVALVGSRSS